MLTNLVLFFNKITGFKACAYNDPDCQPVKHPGFLGPVVQSIVSLTMSLRRQLNYQIHCYFLLEKCENLLQCTFFSTKNINVFVIFTFEMLTNKVVNFEQRAPGRQTVYIVFVL